MARHHIEELLDRWLEAERTGDERVAAERLGVVFRRLPIRGPKGGFVDSVLERIPRAAPESVFASWRLLPAALIALAAASVIAFASLPSTLKLLGAFPSASLIALPAKTFAGIVSLLGELTRIADLMFNLFEASLLVASSLPVVLTLVALTSIAALAFRALTSLVDLDRRSSHAVS